MGSTWAWCDASKKIAVVTLVGDWTPEDLKAYTDDFWPLMAQQPHMVDVILDLRQGGLLPMQPIINLIWLAKHRPANAGRVVFIVKRTLGLAIVRAIQQTIQPLYPQFRISGVLTLEAAMQFLTPPRIDETVEMPASSRAEVGNRLP